MEKTHCHCYCQPSTKTFAVCCTCGLARPSEHPNTHHINLDLAARVAELEQQRFQCHMAAESFVAEIEALKAQVRVLRAACQAVVAHRNIFGPYCPLCMHISHDADCMYGIALDALAIAGEE